MDEKKFKKHLADLAHGHHHPEEHDWGEGAIGISWKPSKKAPDEAASVVEPAKRKKTGAAPAKARSAKAKAKKSGGRKK